jgi:hypothetical protein
MSVYVAYRMAQRKYTVRGRRGQEERVGVGVYCRHYLNVVD